MVKFQANPPMLRSTVMVFLRRKEKQANFIVVVAFLNAPAVMAIVDLTMVAIVSLARNWTKKRGNRKKRRREPLLQQGP